MGSYYISVSHVPKFEEIPAALSIWPLREEYQKMEIIVLIGTNCYRQFFLLNVLRKIQCICKKKMLLYVVISKNVCTLDTLGSNFSSESTLLIMNSAAVTKKYMCSVQPDT